MENLHQPSSILSSARIDEIQSALERSWTKQTCSPKARPNWSEDNKALGQCSVTAMLIAQMFGGELAKNQENNHLWNILPDGSHHDFTRTQFSNNPVDLSDYEITSIDEQLNHPKAVEAETKERFELLKKNFS